MEKTAVQVVQAGSGIVRQETELTVDQLEEQVQKVQQIMKRVMKRDEHYGVIPGCKKPSLLKPGAEKLGFTFRLVPKFTGEREAADLGNGHREYVITCELVSAITGQYWGAGLGSCSTMESKYRFRPGPGTSTGKPVPKEYWNTRKQDPKKAQEILGGQGFAVHKNESGTWEIVEQGAAIENPNIADCYNTVLKMAKKRAHVDAILTATAASDIFTQDMEDKSGTGEGDNGGHDVPPPPPNSPGSEAPPPMSMPKRNAETRQASGGTIPACPNCGGELVVRQGRDGDFYGCKSYRETGCRGTAQIPVFDGDPGPEERFA